MSTFVSDGGGRRGNTGTGDASRFGSGVQGPKQGRVPVCQGSIRQGSISRIIYELDPGAGRALGSDRGPGSLQRWPSEDARARTGWALGLYTRDERILSVARPAMLGVALSIPPYSVVMCLMGALRSAGLQLWGAEAMFISYYAVGLPIGRPTAARADPRTDTAGKARRHSDTTSTRDPRTGGTLIHLGPRIQAGSTPDRLRIDP